MWDNFFSAEWIDLMTFSMKIPPCNSGTASLSKILNVTRVRDSPIQRWRVVVPDTVNFVLDALRISGMSRLRTLFSQVGSKTSARARFRPVPVPKTQIIGRIREEVDPTDIETLSFFLLNYDISPVFGNDRISWYGLFDGFLKVFSAVLLAVICPKS